MNNFFKEGDRVILPGGISGEVKGFTFYEDHSLLYHVQLDNGGSGEFAADYMERENGRD